VFQRLAEGGRTSRSGGRRRTLRRRDGGRIDHTASSQACSSAQSHAQNLATANALGLLFVVNCHGGSGR
jgi:hypothetical protein